jgi:hypothetical protein
MDKNKIGAGHRLPADVRFRLDPSYHGNTATKKMYPVGVGRVRCRVCAGRGYTRLAMRWRGKCGPGKRKHTIAAVTRLCDVCDGRGSVSLQGHRKAEDYDWSDPNGQTNNA